MELTILNKTYIILLLPAIASILVGILGKYFGRVASSCITIFSIAISFCFSVELFSSFYSGVMGVTDFVFYHWADIDSFDFVIGAILDKLSVTMLVVVTSVSLLVHVYSIGYMWKDKSYTRFFSYISFFTFAMLVLVLANNFLQLFFAWEAVGLASYLLIGFWYEKESAVYANLKAFLVNRLGDLGFLLGIALIMLYTNSLSYSYIFAQAQLLVEVQMPLLFGYSASVVDVISILLFIGAMGKSAQIPLHIWLPDSMEGPTPISALIHAATMVTAGVFMVARMSPIFEYSEVALSFILIIGATTSLLMGMVALVQSDIKKIVAYSTLSQLGYMVVALGVSAYSVAIFHLVTHAFFKALLFLGAGAVIVAMHHEQNIFKMGGLYKRLPITYSTMLLASLSLMGVPFFSGFYSKDMIIQVVEHSNIFGSTYAMYAVNIGVFFTAIYSLRLILLVFHGKERMTHEAKLQIREPTLTILLPLIVLVIPSVLLGYFALIPVCNNFFGDAVKVLPEHDVLTKFKEASHLTSAYGMGLHGFMVPAFWLMLFGSALTIACYVYKIRIPLMLRVYFPWIFVVLENKFGFDLLNEKLVIPVARGFACVCAFIFDKIFIDRFIVNGSANFIKYVSSIARRVHTAYLYNHILLITLAVVFLGLWQLVA